MNNGDTAAAREYYQASVDDYTEAIKLDPKGSSMYDGSGWTRCLLGQLESKQGNTQVANDLFQAAITDSDEAIRLKRGKPSATYFYTRAVAKAGLSDYDAAIEDFNEAIRIKPTDATYYRDRGRAKESLGQHEAAKADLAKVKELDPDIENKSD